MSVFSTTDSGLYNGKRDVPVVYSVPRPVTPQTYTRPSDWLAMPTVLSTDEKIVLLVAVNNVSTNYIAFIVATSGGANFTVDWGDGSGPVTYANGTTVNYNFNWSSYSAGTLTTRGYRQAIVTITTTTTLIGFDMSTKYVPTTGVVNGNYSNKILEAAMAGSFNDFNFGDNTNQRSSWMEQVNVVSAGAGVNYTNSFRYCDALVSVLNIPDTTGSSHLQMFYNCPKLQTIPFFNTPNGTNFSYMFYNCSSLISVPDLNTSSAVNLSGMFSGCGSLKTAPQLNTSNATTFSNMFYNCTALSSVPLYDTSLGTDFTYMFNYCYSLKTVPLFNLQSAEIVYGMFWACISLLEMPQFNLPSATNIGLMFYGCTALTTVPTLYLPAATTIGGMFGLCSSLIDVGTIETTGNLTTVSGVFANCYSLISNPTISNTINVTDTQTMFANCYNLTNVTLFDTSNVTNMSNMFVGTRSLASVPDFDTTKVTTMIGTFQQSGIVNGPNFTSTSNVTNMASMFTTATNLVSIPTYDTSKVTNANVMFSGTSSLNYVPNINTSNVTQFNGFLQSSGARYFESGNLDTSKASNITNMFNGATKLNYIPALSLSNVTTGNASGAFATMPSLNQIDATGLRFASSVQGDLLGKTELETFFTNLGNNCSGTLFVGSNPGTDSSVARAMTFTSSSNVLTVANTVGIVAGTIFSGASFNTGYAMTAYANNRVLIGSRLDSNTLISFSSVTTSNLTANSYYYVSNRTGTGPYYYDLSTTPGGTTATFTAGTMVGRISLVAVTVNTNANVILNGFPVVNGTNASISFRQLNTNLASFKGFTVSG